MAKLWRGIGEKLMHKDQEKAEAFFNKLGSKKEVGALQKYFTHTRLGYMWDEDDNLFLKLVKKKLNKRKNVNILEIGCFVGQGAKFFVKAFESVKLKPTVDCVDLAYPYLEEGSTMNYGTQGFHLLKNTEEERMEHKVFLHTGRSRDIVPYLNKDYDVVYIDGEHTSGGVFMDLMLTFKNASEDTAIIVDDLEWALKDNPVANGVKKFIEKHGDHIKETYLHGWVGGGAYGLYKIESYDEMEKNRFDQIVFIVKSKIDKPLDDILKEIKKYKLHLDPVVNPENSKKGGRRTRRNKRFIK
jgi:hypothetical protein